MGQHDTVVLGVDLGTTNAKAAAYGLDGERLAHHDVEVRLGAADDERVEQDPDAILAAAVQVIAAVAADMRAQGRAVAGVGVSGAMHSLLAVDAAGRPLTPALLWADNRATPQVAEIARRTDAGALTARTGTPLHPMTPLAKLRWFAQEAPQVAARAARWISLKEYVLLRLTGAAVVDHSIASATGLLDIATRDWDPEALALAGVDRDHLGALVPTRTVLGLAPGAAARLGLAADVPVVVGASDGPLANLGTGAIEPGVASLTIGTSGAVRVRVDRPRGDATGRLFCYAGTGPDDWVVGGAVSNGGLVLKWARDRLFPDLSAAARAGGEDPYDVIDRAAAAAAPGSGGLVFLPHLAGERAPRWDPHLRGALVGLTVRHGRDEVLRALMEGVVLHLATVVGAMAAGGHPPRAIRASGGFTASDLWLGIAADVLGAPLTVPRRAEGSGFGAALVAMGALGLADPDPLALAVTRDARTVLPDPARADRYRRLLAVYEDLEAALAPIFPALDDV